MQNDMRDRLIEIVKSSLIKHIDKSCCLAENIVDDLLAENVTGSPVAFSDNRRKRMIELLNGYYDESGVGLVHYFTDEESEMLADYILSDGWIRPPCKVGDTVYVDSRILPTHKLDLDDDEIPEYFKAAVVSVRYNSKGCFFKLSIFARWLVNEWDDECGNYDVGREKMCYFTYLASAIGKTVFFTREAAEQALRERESNA